MSKDWGTTTQNISKSGSLDRLRIDVGIVYTRRGRIIMAITTDDNPVVHYTWDGVRRKTYLANFTGFNFTGLEEGLAK